MGENAVMDVARVPSYHFIIFIVFVIVVLSKSFFARHIEIELGLKCKMGKVVERISQLSFLLGRKATNLILLKIYDIILL